MAWTLTFLLGREHFRGGGESIYRGWRTVVLRPSVINLPQFFDVGGYFTGPLTPLYITDAHTPTECVLYPLITSYKTQSRAIIVRLVVIFRHHCNNLLQSGEQGTAKRLRRSCPLLSCPQLSIMGCCHERRALGQLSRRGG